MKPTVLIIDDSPIVIAVTKQMLEGAGYRVLTHGRATGSVSLILQESPDLVLLDVNMPSLKGDTIARMSSRTAQSKGTTVLLHSTLSDAELSALVSQSGAHGYIRKTENPLTFLREVRHWIGGEGSTTLSVSRQIPTTEAASASTQRGASEPGTAEPGTSEPGTSRARDSSAAPHSRKRRGPVTVLLVDRDMTNLSSMRRIVQGMGLRTDFSLSVSQALERLRSAEPPGAIVASAQLPGSGFGQLFSEAVAADHKWADAFIAVTTRAEGTPALPATFRGPIVSQPVAEDTLRRVVGSVVRRYDPQVAQREG